MELIKWLAMGFVYGIVTGILISLLVCKIEIRKEKQEKKLSQKLELELYGLDEEECNDSHLPGDCPLCGGK